MTKESTKCQSCGKKIKGEIYHPGFSNMEALYCSARPMVLLRSDFQLLETNGIKRPILKERDQYVFVSAGSVTDKER